MWNMQKTKTNSFCYTRIFLIAGMLFHLYLFADAASETAEYTVVFESVWSAKTHPVGFPTGPHFSGLIGATHIESVTFWAEGQLATAGIQRMAETGSKSPLDSEIQTAINQGKAEHLLSGGGIGVSPGQVSIASFMISQDYPQVTLVSMIAPSPDWFVGVHHLSLFQDEQWIPEVVIDLFPYDAGTDSGSTYSASNQATQPHVPIQRITGNPFVFENNVLPLGTFTFRKLDQPTFVPHWELYR